MFGRRRWFGLGFVLTNFGQTLGVAGAAPAPITTDRAERASLPRRSTTPRHLDEAPARAEEKKTRVAARRMASTAIPHEQVESGCTDDRSPSWFACAQPIAGPRSSTGSVSGTSPVLDEHQVAEMLEQVRARAVSDW